MTFSKMTLNMLAFSIMSEHLIKSYIVMYAISTLRGPILGPKYEAWMEVKRHETQYNDTQHNDT